VEASFDNFREGGHFLKPKWWFGVESYEFTRRGQLYLIRCDKFGALLKGFSEI